MILKIFYVVLLIKYGLCRVTTITFDSELADRLLENNLKSLSTANALEIISRNDLENVSFDKFDNFNFFELSLVARKLYTKHNSDELLNYIDGLRLKNYEKFDGQLDVLSRRSGCGKNMFYRMDFSLYANRLRDKILYPNLHPISLTDVQCLKTSINEDYENDNMDSNKNGFYIYQKTYCKLFLLFSREEETGEKRNERFFLYHKIILQFRGEMPKGNL